MVKIREFLFDIFEWNKEMRNPNSKKLSIQVLFLPVTVAFSIIQGSTLLLKDLTPFTGDQIRLFASIFTIVICVFLIQRKVEIRKPSVLIEDRLIKVYEYHFILRLFSKVLLLIFLVVLPLSFARTMRQLTPIATPLSGLITDKRGMPIQNATVRILDAEGVNVTQEGKWVTDNDGIYILNAKKKVFQDYFIEVIQICGKSTLLSLQKKHRLAQSLFPQNEYVSFKHEIDACQ